LTGGDGDHYPNIFSRLELLTPLVEIFSFCVIIISQQKGGFVCRKQRR